MHRIIIDRNHELHIHNSSFSVYSNGLRLFRFFVKSTMPVDGNDDSGETVKLIEKGEDVTLEDVLADVNQRDYQDSHREIAPLKPSEDSVMADTSKLNLEESIQLIINIIKERIK